MPVDDPGQPLSSSAQFVKEASTEVRLGFVRKVYGILTCQLLLTVAIATPLQFVQSQWLKSHEWLLWLSIGCTFACICSMACCGHVARKFPQNYLFLAVLTTFEGICVGFVSAQYTWQSVMLAASITFLIFAVMTAFAWTTKMDFTGFGPYLFAAMLVLCMFGLVLTLLSTCTSVKLDGAMMVYNFCGVLLFTFYIVFDTQMILGSWGGHKIQFGIDDYVFAALNLYLDIINLFLYILSLVGSRR